MGINLTKGGNINLSKDHGGLTKVVLGTGWGKKKTSSSGFFGFGGGSSEESVDLDASCVLLDEANNEVESISFSNKRSRTGAVIHQGDDLTGGGSADAPNEFINVDLNQVPANVKTIVFAVQNYGGGGFDGIPNAFSALREHNGSEIARYNLEEAGGSHGSVILSKIYKHNNEWKFKAIGEKCQGKRIADILSDIKRVV